MEIKAKKLNVCHYGSDFANSRSYTLKNGQLKVSSRLDYYRNSKTGYTPCYYKNGKMETAKEHKPEYLRLSQAERELKAKMKEAKSDN